MRIKLIFQKTADDGAYTAWVDIKEVEVEVPDQMKQYHVVGAIMPSDDVTL